MTTTMLPTLMLSQPDVHPTVHEVFPGQRTQRWYVHFSSYAGVNSYDASRSPIAEQLGAEGLLAGVDVILPAVTVGTECDLTQDIRDAVRRHAAKHLGPA